MKHLNKLLITTILSITLLSTQVFALDLFNSTEEEQVVPQGTNFQNISQKDLYELMKAITQCIFDKDVDNLYQYSYMFSQQSFDKLLDYCKTNTLINTPSNYCIDYTTPSYTSTGDTTIMVNIKAYNSDNTNTLYLFEFHINENSQIYGYQVWAY